MTSVLHITTWHPYITGGSGIFIVEQCAALRSTGIEVGLIFSRLEGLQIFSISRLARGLPGFVRLDQPVPAIGFKSWRPPKVGTLVNWANTIILGRLYNAYVKAYGAPDILHGHIALEGGYAAREISRRTGKEYVVTEHSSIIHDLQLDPRQWESARRVYADARCVIAVSESLANRIQEICPEAKVKVIGNVVRNSVFEKLRPKKTTEKRLRAFSLSTLVPGKRLHNAIEAVARLPKDIKARLDYIIIGEGPERRRLEELAHLRNLSVEFRGALNHEEAMSELSSGDLLIHPSARETFGVVLAEALALGIPVVACHSGGPEGFVNPEVGALVPPDDVEGLTAAIHSILSNIGFWRESSNRLSQFATGKFSEEFISQAIIGTY